IPFSGPERAANITYRRLVSCVLLGNGLEVHKSTGQPDFFLNMPPHHSEYIGLLLDRFAPL
ncbi:MAG: hypothetical protein ACHQ7M_17070, partial [Chloroflexota bacterium]